MMICNDVNFTVAGSTPLSKATAFATADIPQSFPPICFWHLVRVTSVTFPVKITSTKVVNNQRFNKVSTKLQRIPKKHSVCKHMEFYAYDSLCRVT